MTTGTGAARRKNLVRSLLALGGLAAIAIAVVIALDTDRRAEPDRSEPDYEAVVRDTVSIIFPGSVASPEQIKDLLPASKRSTDVACDNLADMPRSAVVEYTSLSVGDYAKADMLVASMERNVCSRIAAVPPQS
jgi:hypothetical protein